MPDQNQRDGHDDVAHAGILADSLMMGATWRAG
jgi:hypothetical protein